MVLISDEIINNSLYVTQNLLLKIENETRIKWKIGNILIEFDYENNKRVKGKIGNVFDKEVEYYDDILEEEYKANSEWFCIEYENNKRNVQRFSNEIGPIYRNYDRLNGGRNSILKLHYLTLQNRLQIQTQNYHKPLLL